jgi:hypothetical protein
MLYPPLYKSSSSLPQLPVAFMILLIYLSIYFYSFIRKFIFVKLSLLRPCHETRLLLTSTNSWKPGTRLKHFPSLHRETLLGQSQLTFHSR